MRNLHGISVSPGFAEGKAFVYTEQPVSSSPRALPNECEVPRETARFDRAVAASISELHGLRDRMVAEIGETEAGILDAQLVAGLTRPA